MPKPKRIVRGLAAPIGHWGYVAPPSDAAVLRTEWQFVEGGWHTVKIIKAGIAQGGGEQVPMVRRRLYRTEGAQ